MPSKKKRYNSRFPPARIKKIMQTDEDVGKVAAAVPVIISRALELFIESLILKANETTQNRHAKTLSTAHIKQTIEAEKKFDFLRDLVAAIPDHQPEEEVETTQSAETKKPRVPRQRKPKADGAGPSRRGNRKNSSDSSHLEVDEDDSETESDEENDHLRNTSAQENDHEGNASGQENDRLRHTSGQENDRLENSSDQENDRLRNTSSEEYGRLRNTSGEENDRLRHTSGEESDRVRHDSGPDNDRLRHQSGCKDSSPSVNNSHHTHSDSDTFTSPLSAHSPRPVSHPFTSPPGRLPTDCLRAPVPPEFPYHPLTHGPLLPQLLANAGFPRLPLAGIPPNQHFPVPFFNHSSPGSLPMGYVPPPVFSNLQMYKPPPSEEEDYDA